jgi:hypothetical protein
MVILGIELEREADLVKVAKAGGCAAGLFGAAQSGQQQSREHTDNGKNDQQFNQRKSIRACAGWPADLANLDILSPSVL